MSDPLANVKLIVKKAIHSHPSFCCALLPGPSILVRKVGHFWPFPLGPMYLFYLTLLFRPRARYIHGKNVKAKNGKKVNEWGCGIPVYGMDEC
jgi:hypothetical protein